MKHTLHTEIFVAVRVPIGGGDSSNHSFHLVEKTL